MISNGVISLGDIVFSDGALNKSLGDIFVTLKNRITPFDFGFTVKSFNLFKTDSRVNFDVWFRKL